MIQAKAIYAWWKKLSLWVRIPLSIVLVAALLALVVERIARVIRPSQSGLYRRAQAARVEQNAEKLKGAVEKADERYTEIKKELEHDASLAKGYEKSIGTANTIGSIDDLIAEQIARNKKHQWGKPGDS